MARYLCSMSLAGNTMPSATIESTLRGSCHCGELRVELSTRLDPATLIPRACDCSFCLKHGAAYVSDPAGRLELMVHPDGLRRYRQGSGTAEFLMCDRCGVLVAVTFMQAARIYGAVNARCLDGNMRLGDSATASPQALNPEEKAARWMKLWVPDVRLVASGRSA